MEAAGAARVSVSGVPRTGSSTHWSAHREIAVIASCSASPFGVSR